MLKLTNIIKNYQTADNTVRALKGVSINFRKSEFVSVLGPSGCGKTTLLNIIGGLDGYTEGDLTIDERSTKNYKSRDWDRYRNRTIGFVFQSYNLINHLNILQNVELALTISGVSRKKKKELSVAALEKVGLGNEIKKKPNELSGGQMQRVAIARAIVNNPEIILADEPTGALDTVTSEQVLDILKDIAKDKLVIMVTHNPELAYKYSTRIVEMKDGVLMRDSMPYEPDEEAATTDVCESVPRPEIEYIPVNKSKGGVVAAAGENTRAADCGENAAVDDEGDGSCGVDDAFDKGGSGAKEVKFSDGKDETGDNQDDTEERKPSSESDGDSRANETEIVYSVSAKNKGVKRKKNKNEKDREPKASMSFFTALSLSARNLMTKKMRTALTTIAGSIGIVGIALVLSLTNGFNIYMAELEESTLSQMPVTISNIGFTVNINEMMNPSDSGMTEFPDIDAVLPYEKNSGISGVNVSANFITEEYIEYVKEIDKELVNSVQYRHDLNMNLLAQSANGGIGKVSARSIGWQELLWDDFTTRQYDVLAGGYPGSAEADEVLAKYDDRYPTYTQASDKRARQAVLVISSYNRVEKSILDALGYEVERDPETNSYKPIDFDKILGKQIKVMHHDEWYERDAGIDWGDFFYADARQENIDYMWYESEKTVPVTVCGILRVKDGVTVPALSRGFGYTEELTALVLENNKASAVSVAQAENKDYNVLSYHPFSIDFSPVINMFAAYGVNEATLVKMIKDGVQASEQYSGLYELIKDCATVNEMVDAITSNPETGITVQQLKFMLKLIMISPPLGLSGEVADKILDSGWESAMQSIGALETPASIYIYPKSFDAKQKILDYLDEWNAQYPDDATKQVTYTDMAGTVSMVVEQVVDISSYILIAFAAISLIVSSLMIGIITYISVIERTTEIGVLRAIGARKIDVANVFNAETLIIGVTSGVLGVLLAWVIDFPINAIIAHLVAEAPAQFAVLNPLHGVLLVLLSSVLTVISGLIPASMAAKKDPVKALRSSQ